MTSSSHDSSSSHSNGKRIFPEQDCHDYHHRRTSRLRRRIRRWRQQRTTIVTVTAVAVLLIGQLVQIRRHQFIDYYYRGLSHKLQFVDMPTSIPPLKLEISSPLQKDPSSSLSKTTMTATETTTANYSLITSSSLSSSPRTSVRNDDDISTSKGRDDNNAKPVDMSSSVITSEQQNQTAAPAPPPGEGYLETVATDPDNPEWMDIIWHSVELLDNMTSSTRTQAVSKSKSESRPRRQRERHQDDHSAISTITPPHPRLTLSRRKSQLYDYHECTSPEHHIVEWPFSEEKVTKAAIIPKTASLSDYHHHDDVDLLAAKATQTRRRRRRRRAERDEDNNSTTVVDHSMIHTAHSVIEPSFTCSVVSNTPITKTKTRGTSTQSSSSFADYFYDVIWKHQLMPLLSLSTVRNNSAASTLPVEAMNLTTSMNAHQPHHEMEQHLASSHCYEMVVFGVAFGSKFVRQVKSPNNLRHVNTSSLLSRHGSCFFMFTTVEDLIDGEMISSDDGSVVDENATVAAAIDPNDGLSQSKLLTPFRSANHPFWWIPIPKDRLPYSNHRRNTKMIKYFVGGQFAAPVSVASRHDAASPTTIPLVGTVIWQDAKFFRGDMVTKQPKDDYTPVLDSSYDACVTAIGLPIHPNTVGRDHPTPTSIRLKQRYAHQCRAIISSLQRRPNVTDSPDSLIYQCLAYLSGLHREEQALSDNTSAWTTRMSKRRRPGWLTSQLDYGLVDTALLIWNESTERCRKFNAQFRCSVQSQLHCHSDRDQTNVPFVLMNMKVTGYYQKFRTNIVTTADEWWDPRASDVEYYLNSELSEQDENRAIREGRNETSRVRSYGRVADLLNRIDPVVRILRYNCHWYRSRVGDSGKYGCLFWKRHRRTID